jgi:GAF domain-containing protein
MAAEPVPDELRSVVERSSGRMTSDTTADTLLRLLTSVAQRIVPAAAGAGLVVAGPGPGAVSVSLAPTHGQVELLDSFQYALDEGPCLTSWRNRIVTRVDDVTTEERWPRWCAQAARTPIHCSLSAPLVVGDVALGAVKIYAEGPRAFDEHDEVTLQLVAAQAAILVAQAQAYRSAGELSEALQSTLRQRDDLNRACGMVMQRENVSVEAAMSYLMSVASRDGRSVHDVAARLVRRAGPGSR